MEEQGALNPQRLKILIAGGGLGGMMLAASLKRRGMGYELVEKTPRDSGQGFSLGIWCNTRALFASLGLQDQLAHLGTPMYTYEIREGNGQLLRSFRFDQFYQRYGMAYTQVNRHELRELLLLQADPKRIRFGTTLQSLKHASSCVEVVMSDGSTGTYDLVVGADGVNSVVRQFAFGASLQRFTGWRAWYVWIDRKFCPPNAMVEYLGAGRCVGIFADGDRALAIFFAAIAPTAADDPRDRIASLKTVFHRELACMPGALSDIADDQVMTTDLATVKLHQPSRGPVVLIGDSAHAFEPHTGLGGSMAMEDAAVLAEHLQRVSPRYSLATALHNYQKERQSRVTLAQRLNRNIRMLAFIKSPLLRRLANACVGFAPEQIFTRDYYRLFDASPLRD